MTDVERSHGKLRVRATADRLPEPPASGLAAPDRDPTTGQFQPGNTASRRRKIKRLAKSLPWLKPADAEEWLRPFLVAAKSHAVDLLADVADHGPVVAGVAEELALARVVARALIAEGARKGGDPKALNDARQWMREARQFALTLSHLVRGHDGGNLEDEDDVAARRRAFQRQLAEEQRQQKQPAIDTAATEERTS